MDYKPYILPGGIVLGAILVSLSWIITTSMKLTQRAPTETAAANPAPTVTIDQSAILPPAGVTLPVRWGDLGSQLVKSGVIDQKKFEAIYANQGGLAPDEQRLLTGTDNGNLKITQANSGFLLNLLWALGLGNKNEILDNGPMNDPQFGGAGGFASTGGWTLARGEAMDHYSRHALITLAPEQQTLVANVAKNIYRPCCNNATYFPDCNHGMAMFGLLELAASQGVNEDDLYRLALQVNAFWFPDTYLTIAKFLATQGSDWREANPRDLLGTNFSSGSGYRQILSQVEPVQPSGGNGCGV